MLNMEVKCEYTELVDIDSLVINPKNPNQHDARQISILAKNIKFQGWRHPIIVSKRSGFVCAGHGRLEAARELELKSVPVDYQDFDSEASEYAFMVADNKLASLAVHDDALMIDTLKEMDFDLDFDLLGIPDFSLIQAESFDGLIDEPKLDVEKKYKLEVQFTNDMDMMDIHDDLASRGYLVKVL